jgi:hypothetical protein
MTELENVGEELSRKVRIKKKVRRTLLSRIF